VRHRLDLVVEEIRRIVVADFSMVAEVSDYLLLLPGKLLRPSLVLLSNEVGESPHADAVTFAALVELVHLATLVHDDAVDHSILRRGQPTVNSLWNHQVAIIMGDYLYSRAVTELARVGHLEAIRILAEAANEMSVGEMRQLTAYDRLDFSEQEYDRLIAAKTASLMAAACAMGALVGREELRPPLRRFGYNLGMAFQVVDDILDYVGVEEETGKPAGGDLRERKVTLPLVGALRQASPAAQREVRDFFTGPEPATEDIVRMVALVRELGGVDYARARAEAFAAEAGRALEGLPDGAATRSLRDSITYVIERNR
jgi:octaprenyl-diphosphate synthase